MLKNKINFLFSQARDSESKFIKQFTDLISHEVRLINLNNEKLPEIGLNIYVVNVILPKWLIKEECHQYKRKHFTEEIPSAVLNSVRKNEAFILLDNSGEGPSNQKYLRGLHAVAQELEFSPSRIIWVHQNLAINDDYAQWLKPMRLDHENSQILNLYWHSFLIETIERSANIKFDIEFKTTPRKKWFLCLNNIPRPERVLVLLRIYAHNISSKGLISFRSQCLEDPSISFDKSLEILLAKFDSFEMNAGQLQEVRSMLPMVLDSHEDPSKSTLVKTMGTELFQDTYFSIITESEMSSGHVKRFTEKVLKPVFNYHPFVVFGNPHTLKLLRNMGFKTFDGWIDESYDLILNKEERAGKAFAEVIKLTNKSIGEIQSWYDSMESVLKYNRHHLITNLHKWVKDGLAQATILRLVNCEVNQVGRKKQEVDFAIRLALDQGFLQDLPSIKEMNLIALGDALSDKELYSEANDIYNIELKSNPEDSGITNRIASNFFKKKNYDLAIDFSIKTVGFDPQAYWSWNLLGHVYHIFKKDYLLAFEYYAKAYRSSGGKEVYLNLLKTVFIDCIKFECTERLGKFANYLDMEIITIQKVVSEERNDQFALEYFILIEELKQQLKKTSID